MNLNDVLVIAAPVERVWQLTLDVERLPELTPTVTSVTRLDDGPLQLGSRTRLKQPRQRPAIWTVVALEPPHHFAWQAKVLGVTMTGSHRLEAVDRGCRNTLTLTLEGPGSGLLARVAGRQMRAAIATENRGFKAAAEAG